MVVMFNTILNTISVISVLLMDETEYLRKTNNLPQVTDQFYHTMLYRVQVAMRGIRAQCIYFVLVSIFWINIGKLCKNITNLGK